VALSFKLIYQVDEIGLELAHESFLFREAFIDSF
jgi:hypothetical protein